MSGGSFQPRSERELADTFRGCSAQGRRVRLSGGGVVARVPGAETLGVWMFGLSGFVDIRAADLVATAKAGTSLAEIATDLRERGRRFPLRPHDAGERATVGGVFAAGADGLASRLGFRARDVLLGARAVLSTGEIVFVGATVVKSVAGFDVCKALTGSRGCLAALTEVTFRVEAIPEAIVTWRGEFAGRGPAHGAVAAADALPLVPAAIVVSGTGGPVRVDVLLEGPRAAVAAAGARLATAGLREASGEWEALTAFTAAEPPAGLVRTTGPALRAAPLDALPLGTAAYVVDVARGCFTAHAPQRAEPPRVPDALIERVRHAFDPAATFEPGRGIGAR